ncbi:MAG: DUF4440 domain-containing protein [Fulvivirga sp.]|nr:DUF4440 domain-containing protein [Fulvivirga sp.]
MKYVLLTLIGLLLMSSTPYSYAQNHWTPEQLELLQTISQFSETTSPEGRGADAYAAFLTEDFTRWTIGNDKINNKMTWVDGVREWFDDGWRVSERESTNLHILIKDNFAFTRRIVTETYLGPDGDTSKAKAALAEVWIKKQSQWKLFSVNVHPIVE